MYRSPFKWGTTHKSRPSFDLVGTKVIRLQSSNSKPVFANQTILWRKFLKCLSTQYIRGKKKNQNLQENQSSLKIIDHMGHNVQKHEIKRWKEVDRGGTIQCTSLADWKGWVFVATEMWRGNETRVACEDFHSSYFDSSPSHFLFESRRRRGRIYASMQ